jgi:AcrR family transcriptional regulator
MVSPVEKAMRDPKSMKARILIIARKLFAKHGYSGTTTRMIAKEVGIDISTLYYHWGEKADLYEAVLVTTQETLRVQLSKVEKVIHGRPLSERLEIAIDMFCDYFSAYPEITSLILLNYFTKPKNEINFDFALDDIIAGIAVSMELAQDKTQITAEARARVLAVTVSLFNFIAGKRFFRPIINEDSEGYLRVVKETLKFILVPAFSQEGEKHDSG